MDKLREELTCSICLQLLSKPKMLPCLHSFCENCIADISKEKQKVKCPLDSKEFNIEKSGFPNDFFKNNLLETLRSVEIQVRYYAALLMKNLQFLNVQIVPNFYVISIQ
jgi:hypothetical protein